MARTWKANLDPPLRTSASQAPPVQVLIAGQTTSNRSKPRRYRRRTSSPSPCTDGEHVRHAEVDQSQKHNRSSRIEWTAGQESATAAVTRTSPPLSTPAPTWADGVFGKRNVQHPVGAGWRHGTWPGARPGWAGDPGVLVEHVDQDAAVVADGRDDYPDVFACSHEPRPPAGPAANRMSGCSSIRGPSSTYRCARVRGARCARWACLPRRAIVASFRRTLSGWQADTQRMAHVVHCSTTHYDAYVRELA
jgi:hypothetical protein